MAQLALFSNAAVARHSCVFSCTDEDFGSRVSAAVRHMARGSRQQATPAQPRLHVREAALAVSAFLNGAGARDVHVAALARVIEQLSSARPDDAGAPISHDLSSGDGEPSSEVGLGECWYSWNGADVPADAELVSDAVIDSHFKEDPKSRFGFDPIVAGFLMMTPRESLPIHALKR